MSLLLSLSLSVCVCVCVCVSEKTFSEQVVWEIGLEGYGSIAYVYLSNGRVSKFAYFDRALVSMRPLVCSSFILLYFSTSLHLSLSPCNWEVTSTFIEEAIVVFQAFCEATRVMRVLCNHVH